MPRLLLCGSRGLLRRRRIGDPLEAKLAQRVVGGHYRLPWRARIGTQQHGALAVVAGNLDDRALERFDVGTQRFAIVDEVTAIGVDQYAERRALRVIALAIG